MPKPEQMVHTNIFAMGESFWILFWIGLAVTIIECSELIGSGCYNNAGFWIDKCPKNKVIHVKRAFYGKRWPYDNNDTTRCTFREGDCVVDTDYPFERCNDKHACYIGISTLWVERSCEAYPTYTDYIQVHYDCVMQGAFNTTSTASTTTTIPLNQTAMDLNSSEEMIPANATSTRGLKYQSQRYNTPPLNLINRLKSFKRRKPTIDKTTKGRLSKMETTPTKAELVSTSTERKETPTNGTKPTSVESETSTENNIPSDESVTPTKSHIRTGYRSIPTSVVGIQSSKDLTKTDPYKNLYSNPLKPPYLDEFEYYDMEPYPVDDFASFLNPSTKNTETPKTEPTRHIWYIWSEKDNKRPKKTPTLIGGGQRSRILKVKPTYPLEEEKEAPLVSNRNQQEESTGIKVGKWITGTDWGIGLMCLLALVLMITMAILVVVTRKIRERRKSQSSKTTNKTGVKPSDNEHQMKNIAETKALDDISSDEEGTINGKHTISRKIAASAKRLFDKKQKGQTDSCASSISIDIPDPMGNDGLTVNPAFKDSSTDSDMHSNSLYGDCNIYDNNHYAVTGLCEPPLKKLNETMEDKIRRLSMRGSKRSRKYVTEEDIYEEPVKKSQLPDTPAPALSLDEAKPKSEYSRLGFMHQHLPQWGSRRQHKMYLPENDPARAFHLSASHNPRMNKKMEVTMEDWYLKTAGHLATIDDIANMIPDDNEQNSEMIEEAELTSLKRTRTLPYKKGSLGRMFGRLRRSMKATMVQSDKGVSLSYNHEYPTIYAFVNGPDVSHGKLKKKSQTLPLRRRGTFPKKALTIKRDAWKRFGGSFKIAGSGKKRSSILNSKDERAPSACSSKQSSIVDLTNTRRDDDEDYVIKDLAKSMLDRRFTLPEPNEEPLPLHLRNTKSDPKSTGTMENFKFSPLLPKFNHFNSYQKPVAPPPPLKSSILHAIKKENKLESCKKKTGNIPQAPPILNSGLNESPSPGPPKHKPPPPDIIAMGTHNVKPSDLVNATVKYEVNKFPRTRRESQQVKELQQNIKDVLNRRISEQIKKDTKKAVPHPFKKDRVFIENEVYHTPCDVEGKTSL
ncbi:unnamed protein product [Owenia fusiformis]|uniref:Uncharacterized protein n=1 Tax=Owenia fusiformis TaxID=6347 RepID=A0A8J1TD51_OWEFU|nr:unnamed protein product [Owenia fusiformis]